MRVPGRLAGALLLAVTAAELSAEDARAAGDVGPAVLDALTIAGDASRDIQGVIRKALLRGLADGGARVLELPDEVTTPCADPGCASGRARQVGATFLVSARVQVSQRNYEMKLELLDGRDGRVLATRSASCPICSVPEVEAAASDVARALVPDFKLPEPEARSFTITSSPAGAQVYVDGELVGQAPLTRELVGEHRVEVKLAGHLDAGRTVTFGSDTGADALDFTLVPRPGEGASVKMALGWAAVGLGAAGLLTGVALLAVDERPYRGLCDGEYVDSFGRCRFQYNTLAGGVAGVVAGVALVGAGAALLVLDRKGKAPARRQSARVRLGVDPRGVTLIGRF